MRGKFAVIGMVVLSAAVVVFGYWFLFVKSPVEQRFKLNRTDIPRALDLAGLLPDAVGDFKRLAINPVQQGANGTMEGNAIYADTDGKKIVLRINTVKMGKTPTDTLQAYYQPVLRQYPGNLPVLQPQAPFPYGFFTAKMDAADGKPGYVYSDFTWLNGDWILQSSTLETDPESLLQFVNIYPY